jgi:hypothetical protein
LTGQDWHGAVDRKCQERNCAKEVWYRKGGIRCIFGGRVGQTVDRVILAERTEGSCLRIGVGKEGHRATEKKKKEKKSGKGNNEDDWAGLAARSLQY